MRFEQLKKRIARFNEKYNIKDRWYRNITDILFIVAFYTLLCVSIIAKHIGIAGERLSEFLDKDTH